MLHVVLVCSCLVWFCSRSSTLSVLCVSLFPHVAPAVSPTCVCRLPLSVHTWHDIQVYAYTRHVDYRTSTKMEIKCPTHDEHLFDPMIDHLSAMNKVYTKSTCVLLSTQGF